MPDRSCSPETFPRISILHSPHQNAFFAELAELIAAELTAMGVESSVVTDPDPRLVDERDVFVLLPPHEWVALEGSRWIEDPLVAARTIGVSAEQPGSVFFRKNAEIGRSLGAMFDMSIHAVQAFRSLGLDARHLPFGYAKSWDRFNPEGNRGGPDIVFLGGAKDRRLEALGRLATTLGAHRSHLVLGDTTAPNTASSRWFVAGEEKRRLLASSKILLNIHQSDVSYFEWLRFAEAAMCGTVVLTEPSSHTYPYAPGLHFAVAEIDDMPDAIEELLSNDRYRNSIRISAYDAVRRNPFSEHLVHLVAAARNLCSRPALSALPERTRSTPLPHQHEVSPRPEPPTTGHTRAGACSVELLLVGNCIVNAPTATATGPVTLQRVDDLLGATRAARESRADAVGIVQNSADITSGTLSELQNLIRSGADAASAMSAMKRDGRWTLRGLWSPTSQRLDLTSIDEGWVLARPSVVLPDGSVTNRRIGHIPSPALIERQLRPHGVTVVMATYEPDSALFHAQISSLQSQSYRDFTCVISDDNSSPDSIEMIRTVIAGDTRFDLRTHSERVGVRSNFERGIRAALEQRPRYLALCDQDDVWFSSKLERAVRLLERSGASLAFSDAVPVGSDRREIATSFYERRFPTTKSVLDLAMTNSSIGATSVFRSELLDVALPFPPPWYKGLHDHWLAQCAQVTGGIVFDRRPSMEYVQHTNNVQGFTAIRHPVRPLLHSLLRRAPEWTEKAGDDRSHSAALRRARLHLLGSRVPANRRLRRAIRLHDWWLSGSRSAMLSLLIMFLFDQHVRRRSRHEGVEIHYLRAARALRDEKGRQRAQHCG